MKRFSVNVKTVYYNRYKKTTTSLNQIKHWFQNAFNENNTSK